MPDKKIAVAILNWNGARLLEQFLPSVIKHSTELAKVYVIDNASTEDSLDVLQENFPSVSIIQNEANLGYAGGYNRGIEKIEEEYIVLLNSDVEVTDKWLGPLLQRMESEPDSGAIQPRIKDYVNRDFFEYAGAAGGFMDKLAYPFCRGRLFYELEKDEGQYDTYREVFWATGACLMVRRSAYLKAGGLNERLFAHMEEIDLCWRMHNLGFKVACEPASTVFHLGGGTLNKLSSRKTFLNFRNNLIIIFLNLPALESFKIIFSRLVLDGVAALKFLADRQPSHFLAVMKAHFSFYALFSSLVREKKSIIQKPLQNLPAVYKRSLVLDFFVKKRQKFSELDQSQITGN